jgi:hypothetical protein
MKISVKAVIFYAFRTIHNVGDHRIGHMATLAEKSFIDKQATVKTIDYPISL